MNISDFELLNHISAIINTESGSNDAAIAEYLIAHLRHREAISVTAIMHHAHVTRSAVRRFCNRLGYHSLSDLKSSFSQLVFPSDIRHRDPGLGYEEYRAALDVGMLEMYAEVESRVSDTAVRQLADEIQRRSAVEVLCTNNVSGNLIRFQQEMFYAGKVVRISTGSGEAAVRAAPESLNDSLLIVVSVSGMFAASVRERVVGRTAKKVLVTAFCNEATARGYDVVYYLSGRGNGIDHLGLYSKYAVTYFFDLLSSCYISRYPSTKGEPLYGPASVWPD